MSRTAFFYFITMRKLHVKNNIIKKYAEQRPWGKFEQFTHDRVSTVKILEVNPNQAISLQYHRGRSEFWKVICGTGRITIGEAVHDAKEGDEFFIPVGKKHRIQADSCLIKVLEISFGKFDENDIVRLEDKYSRVS